MSLIHLTQYNTLQVHPCCCKRQDFVICRSWVVFHCVCTEKMCPSFLTNNLLTALRLLPYLDNCKQHCYKHWGAFQISGFFGYMPRNGIAGSCDNSIFSFFEKPLYYFPVQLCQFTLLPIVYKGSLFSTSLPTFVIFVLFDDRNSKRLR